MAQAREFHWINQGKVPPSVSMAVKQACENSVGKKLCLSLSEDTNKRSNKENRYWWGVVVQHVREIFMEAGNDISPEDTHEFIKQHVLASLDTIFMPDGKRKFIVRSSTKWTTKEFEDNAEKVRAWAANLGYRIPLPNEEKSQ